MKNQMKRIEKLGIGKMKICFKSFYNELNGETYYPKKSTIIVECSRNNARSYLSSTIRENRGVVSKLYWNGKEIDYNQLKVVHRAIAA